MTLKQFEARLRAKSDAELIQFCNTLGYVSKFLRANYTGSGAVHTNPDADAIITKILMERELVC